MKNRYELLYWGIADLETSPGIYYKITDFVTAANSLGYKANAKICPPSNYLRYIWSLLEIFSECKNIVILRYNNTTGLVLFIVALMLRLTGRKVIFDIPTPISSHLRNIYSKKNKTIKDNIELLVGFVFTPIIFSVPNLLINYSIESKYFSAFTRNKSIIIGNSIDVDAWPEVPIKKRPKCLRLIAVGAIAKWHAWDKVIEAINVCLKRDPQFKVNLTIVGDGPELEHLKNLTSKLLLSEVVNFKGMLAKNDLINLYRESDLGVGTFGWSNLNIEIASPLKYREYLANGLPFIYSTDDPDLPEGNNVSFKVDNEINSIAHQLLTIKTEELPDEKSCREYCKNNMDYRSKISRIMNYLLY